MYDRLPILIVRPFNYTGVGQSDRFLVPKLVRYFAHREALLEAGQSDVVRELSTSGWLRRLLPAAGEVHS